MRLTGRQLRELQHLKQSNRPLWGGVAPADADPDLAFYIDQGLVARMRDGYVLTPHARELLSRSETIARYQSGGPDA